MPNRTFGPSDPFAAAEAADAAATRATTGATRSAAPIAPPIAGFGDVTAAPTHSVLQDEEMEEVTRRAGRIAAGVASVILGKEEVIRACVVALLAGGHIIVEDFPGVGKTLLAKSLARSVDCRFARIQFTPDLLPSDVTGVSVFNQKSGEFEFRPGPIFANIVLTDEINRASPKTQSSLLECMEERQATIDNVTAFHRPAVHGDRYPEPDRVRGHLSPARGSARPLHDAPQPWLSLGGSGGGRSSASRPRITRSRNCVRCSTALRCSP